MTLSSLMEAIAVKNEEARQSPDYDYRRGEPPVYVRRAEWAAGLKASLGPFHTIIHAGALMVGSYTLSHDDLVSGSWMLA